MKERMNGDREKKQRLEDFFSKENSFDTKNFVEEVNRNISLRKVLRSLDRMSYEEVHLDKLFLWKELVQQLHKRQRRRLLWRWRVTAAIMMPVLLFSVYFFLNKSSNKNDISLTRQRHEKELVQLVLSDGEVLQLTGISSDTLIQKENIKIQLKKQLEMKYTNDKKEKIPFYHTLRVPKGNEYYLILPDSTQVWLNSESELRFPSSFVNNERKVFLVGEGYFSVKCDSLAPFRVIAEELQVEVLGTSFDVNTYRDNGYLTTTLIEGRVKVKDTVSGQEFILKPNQQLVFSSDSMSVQTVRVDEVVAWMNGRFLFSGMPLEQIAKQLERWFDIHIVFRDNALRSYQFTGVIKRYDSLETILSIIEETTDIHFEIRDKKDVVVSHKR